ncbi:MAG: carboxypeptidase-like regulatory domain-containing protein [Bacteroidetes bacterium]|nr:carboxypeptidase-like regulatory domain-containing protein [Bacteroidota bacterium]
MRLLKSFRYKVWLVIVFFLAFYVGHGQTKILKGIIRDAHSGERIPFASMRFLKAGTGKLSDSAGTFTFRFDNSWPRDTLEISYVGFNNYEIPFSDSMLQRSRHDTLYVSVMMERGKYVNEVVVKAKVDRGLLLWRKIVRRKPFNDRYRFKNFSYELYNKLELDLNRVNKEKLKGVKLLRPFDFILENIDSSEDHPFLPVFLTETISDYYYQQSPLKRREVIKGSKTLGVDNESVSKMLGGMDQNVDFYRNFVPVFDKRFVSPISNNGDNYYRYKIIDTQYVNARRFFHLIFTPKRKGENTFEGDCWVHDTTFAIQKMNLRLDASANLNFIEELSLIQEFQLINDTTWFLSKDKFVINVTPLKNKMGFIGRKTTTYKNVVINSDSVVQNLNNNKNLEEVLFMPGAREQTDSFWTSVRHEELSKNEKAVYHMIDTLMKMPLFHTYTNVINFLGTGYLDVGKFQIGPWYNWIYANELQGLRLRFDLGTNRYFSKNVILHGYMAYGFGDQKWHGEGDAMYLFNRNPRFSIYAMYRQDLDYGQQYYDEITSDNIFALAVRKPSVPIKFLNLEEEKLEVFKEWHSGFSVTLTGDHKVYDPIRNLPPKEIYLGTTGQPLNTFEASVNLRFAYLEKFFESTFYRTSLGSDYPIIDFRYTRGIPGVFNSSYTYSKIFASVSDYIKVPPFGSIYYNVFGGQTFSSQPLPFPLLNVVPGNETYYYNRYAFSLMNKFQYILDKYVGLNFEHNVGNGLFRFIPITRKLKFRQFWTAKAIWGTLSDANAQYNNSPGYTFASLDGKPYLELGTGVDNIFKMLRFDFVWRILPQPLPSNRQQRFGIFGSFRLAF